MMRAGHHVRNELGVRRVGYRGLKHSNDGRSARIEANLLPDHRRIAVQHGVPETVGKHRGACSIRSIVAHVEEPAKHRAQAHDLEVRAAHYAGTHFAWFAEPNHRETDRRKFAKVADRLHTAAQVLNFGYRKTVVFRPNARGALSNVNQAIFAAVYER